MKEILSFLGLEQENIEYISNATDLPINFSFVFALSLNISKHNGIILITQSKDLINFIVKNSRTTLIDLKKKERLYFARAINISHKNILSIKHYKFNGESFILIVTNNLLKNGVFENNVRFSIEDDVVRMDYHFVDFKEIQDYSEAIWKKILDLSIRRGLARTIAELFPMFENQVKNYLLAHSSKNLREEFLFFGQRGIPRGLAQKRLKEKFVNFIEQLIKEKILPPSKRYTLYLTQCSINCRRYANSIIKLIKIHPENLIPKLTNQELGVIFKYADTRALATYFPQRADDVLFYIKTHKRISPDDDLVILKNINQKAIRDIYGFENIEKLKKAINYHSEDLLNIHLSSPTIFAAKAILYFKKGVITNAEKYMRFFFQNLQRFKTEEDVLNLRQYHLFEKVMAIKAAVIAKTDIKLAYSTIRECFKRSPDDAFVCQIYCSVKEKFMRTLGKTFDKNILLASLYNRNQNLSIFH